MKIIKVLVDELPESCAERDELIEAAAYVIEHATIEDAPSDAIERWYTLQKKWQAYNEAKVERLESNE